MTINICYYWVYVVEIISITLHLSMTTELILWQLVLTSLWFVELRFHNILGLCYKVTQFNLGFKDENLISKGLFVLITIMGGSIKSLL